MGDTMLVSRQMNPGCILPDDPTRPVWRYMDTNKFLFLLATKKLYFCRADILQDHFEGTYPEANIKLLADFLNSTGKSSIIEKMKKDWRKARKSTYISCWCMHKCDLDLMWKGYVPDGQGIAIKSSVGKLVEVCDKADKFWPLDLTQVEYIDFESPPGECIGSFLPFMWKDKHFELDNEIRIIHQPNISVDPDEPPNNVLIPVELDALLEEVIIKSDASEDYVQFIRETLGAAGLAGIPVRPSRYNVNE